MSRAFQTTILDSGATKLLKQVKKNTKPTLGSCNSGETKLREIGQFRKDVCQQKQNQYPSDIRILEKNEY